MRAISQSRYIDSTPTTTTAPISRLSSDHSRALSKPPSAPSKKTTHTSTVSTIRSSVVSELVPSIFERAYVERLKATLKDDIRMDIIQYAGDLHAFTIQLPAIQKTQLEELADIFQQTCLLSESIKGVSTSTLEGSEPAVRTVNNKILFNHFIDRIQKLPFKMQKNVLLPSTSTLKAKKSSDEDSKYENTSIRVTKRHSNICIESPLHADLTLNLLKCGFKPESSALPTPSTWEIELGPYKTCCLLVSTSTRYEKMEKVILRACSMFSSFCTLGRSTISSKGISPSHNILYRPYIVSITKDLITLKKALAVFMQITAALSKIPEKI